MTFLKIGYWSWRADVKGQYPSSGVSGLKDRV